MTEGLRLFLPRHALTILILRIQSTCPSEMDDRKLASAMRVVSKARLRHFWRMPGHEDSESPLLDWYDTVKDRNLSWRNFAEIKATYASASIFNECVIFNIGGNKYRLIARIRYPYKVYLLHVLTHRAYDKGLWKAECRCGDRHTSRPENGDAIEGK